MTGLTDRQQETLDYLREFIRTRKFPPSIREVAEHFGISVRAAYEHVKALEKKGHIRTDPNRSRALELVEDNPETPDEPIDRLPILGTVVAGIPLESQEHLEGWFPMPRALLKGGSHFALRVKGDSMEGAGIHDGDLAIIRQQAVAENGDIVVAMIDEAITIKRFFREANRVHLKAENPAYPSIFTRDARILGRLAHVIRTY